MGSKISIGARAGCCILVPASLIWYPARAAGPDWPDSLLARTSALALIDQLRVALLTEPSATATLEHWCSVHGLAPVPVVRAVPSHDAPVPLPDTLRASLRIASSEPVRYRHVLLMCGSHVLSDAQNWYLPARLTPEMNRRLDSSDTPFGKVVAPLSFERRTLSSDLLWSPLPSNWPQAVTQGNRTLQMPEPLFRNRAILIRGADRLPFAALIETYRRDLLAFALPQPPHR